MTILAFEFSSSTRSVAVRRGDSTFETVETGGRSTAAFRMVETVLARAGVEREQVDRIAVGLGPGSYTGIRAAIAIAQGWKLARPVQWIGVGSALAIAAQAQSQKIFGAVNVVIDAQRGELYLASYEISELDVKEIRPLAIVSPEAVAGEGTVVGPEVTRWFSAGKVMPPTASMIAALAAKKRESDDGLDPIYLRETTFVKAPAPRAII